MDQEVTRITSFSINHDILLPGLYVSRVDGDVTTYDMRTRRPNTGDLMDNSTMHSLEHMFATYIRNGDYLIPNITLESTEQRPLNKYGRMRRTFLKEHRPTQYSILAMSQKLFPHLWEIQETAERRLNQMMEELLAQNPAPDKATDPMAWVQHMNSLKAQAEETIFAELIYS